MPNSSRTSPRFALIPEVHRIGEALRGAGGRPVLVGGWVRDMLMGIAHGKDFDLEVFGLALPKVRQILRRFGWVHSVGRHFGVLKLSTDTAEYDVSVPRRESNIGKGHRGFWVRTDPSMTFTEAAARRDFTINAMGYAFLDDELLDPYAGHADLEHRLLRHVGPAFGEDPLRVLRAMQFAGRFGFDIVPETLAICREQDLGELPRERVWGEVQKLLLLAPRPSWGFGYAKALGVLPYFPELECLHDLERTLDAEGRYRPWSLTMSVLDHAAALRQGDQERDQAMMCAALCHLMPLACPRERADDPAEADRMIAAFLNRLTNATELTRRVLALVHDLETPERLYRACVCWELEGGPTGPHGARPWESDVRRLALRVELPYLLRFAVARHRALHGEAPFVTGVWLEAEARRLGVWEQPPKPLLLGRHLLERGMRPGPHMGDILKEAFQLQLDGELRTLEEALAWLDSGQCPAPGGDGVPEVPAREGP